jgi:hypothetical protein
VITLLAILAGLIVKFWDIDPVYAPIPCAVTVAVPAFILSVYSTV